jgi:hypothetical protein
MEEQIFGNGEEVIEISIYRKDGKILSIPYHTVKKGLEVFATRIVEEVGKELIEELKVRHDEHICSGCGEGFSCDYEDVYEEIRTKLQKMKGDL